MILCWNILQRSVVFFRRVLALWAKKNIVKMKQQTVLGTLGLRALSWQLVPHALPCSAYFISQERFRTGFFPGRQWIGIGSVPGESWLSADGWHLQDVSMVLPSLSLPIRLILLLSHGHLWRTWRGMAAGTPLPR